VRNRLLPLGIPNSVRKASDHQSQLTPKPIRELEESHLIIQTDYPAQRHGRSIHHQPGATSQDFDGSTRLALKARLFALNRAFSASLSFDSNSWGGAPGSYKESAFGANK